MSDDLIAEDGADAILITSFGRPNVNCFERVSHTVKVISMQSIGVDHIGMRAAVARGIAIGYTPNVVIDATADLLQSDA